jgi:membrane-associated phospholipid phosphatase
VGRSFVLGPASLVLYGAGWGFDHPDLRQAGIGCVSSNFATTISRTLLSRIVGRLRPRYDKGAFQFEVNPVIGGTWEMRSFPGGHASNIMTCVSFWNNRFDLGAAGPALYGVAIGVGWARVMDGAHWPSDTFLGEAYGWSVGRTVANRHLQRLPDESVALGGRGIGFRLRFSF